MLGPQGARLGYSVRSLFAQLGKPISDSDPLYKRFEVWLIPHRVSIIRRAGLSEPTAVGIQVRYENGEKTCSIVSLFPSFQYLKHGCVALEAGGQLSASGEIALVEGSTDSTGAEDVVPVARRGATLAARASVSTGLAIECAVVTPVLSCVGLGSSECEWRFDKRSEPLFGRTSRRGRAWRCPNGRKPSLTTYAIISSRGRSLCRHADRANGYAWSVSLSDRLS
jgi:hypothetical protein